LLVCGCWQKLKANNGGEATLLLPFPLDEFDAVSVGVFDEEDAGSAPHRVWFALEIHASGLFEFVCEGIEVFDGERDVGVSLAERVWLGLIVIQREFEARLGVAGDGEESVRRVVSDRNLPSEFEAEFVRIKINAPVEVENPITCVDVLQNALLLNLADFPPSIVANPRADFR
jgi:hypothetical protein